MRIGLTGGGSTPEKIVEQAERAEADGFSSLWYASAVQGDPLVAMALAGRATSSIELGTAVLQTYPCHPLLLARRAVLWMASAAAIKEHVVPRITRAAAAAGRSPPRIVAGVPVAVHDDEDEARAVIAAGAGVYANRPNYQRIMAVGGARDAGDVAIVGNETAVEAQLHALLDAGATDVWAAVTLVGDDRRASLARTTALLCELANEKHEERSTA